MPVSPATFLAIANDFLVATSNQNRGADVHAAPTANGGFLVVWNAPDAGNDTNVRVRSFDAIGVPTNGFLNDILVNTTTAQLQHNPRVAELTNGNFVVAWDSNDPGFADIRARVFSNTGVPLNISGSTDDFLVSTSTNNIQANPQVAALTNGRFAIVWNSLDNGADNDVRGRVFNADGTPSSVADFLVGTSSGGEQVNQRITALSGGGYVVTWQSTDLSAHPVIRGRVFGADGSPLAANDFLISNVVARDEANPLIASLPNGGFVVAWESQDNGFDRDIHARIYDANGAQVNQAAGDIVISTTNGGEQLLGSLTVLPNGRIFIAWTGGGNNSNSDVWGRLFEIDGSPVNVGGSVNDFVVNNQAIGDQSGPEVTALSGGGFAVTWIGSQGASDSDVFGRVFNAGGSVAIVNGSTGDIAISSTNTNNQYQQQIVPLSNGGFAAVWLSLETGGGAVLRSRVWEPAPRIPILSLTSDTGWSASDKITNIGSLSVASIEAGASVQYSTNGGVDWSNSASVVEGQNSVVVRQIDAAGFVSGISEAFIFTLDSTSPNVGSVAITGATINGGSGTLLVGQSSSIQVGLNEGVHVGGNPRLTLNNGGIATYNSVLSSDSILFFDYVVQAGESTNDLAIVAFDFNGASIVDISGNSLSPGGAVTNPAGIVNTVAATESSDLIVGSNLADSLQAFGGNDTLRGLDGADNLNGGAGNDSIDGGIGRDVAIYSAARGNYSIGRNVDGSVSIVDNRNNAPDGVDTLVNVEALQFSDSIVSLPALPLGPRVVSDLSNDWVDGVNQNGQWAFRYASPTNIGVLGGTIDPTVRTSDPWGSPQESFGDLPGIFRSNGAELFAHGWNEGDVVAHSSSSQPIAIVWTAASDSIVTVSGHAWMTRDVGRDNHFGLYIPGVYGFELSTLTTDVNHPYAFSYTTPGTMAAGSFVEFWTRGISNFGDYIGIDLEIIAAPTDGTVRSSAASRTLASGEANLIYSGGGSFAGTGNGVANVFVGLAGNDTFSGGDGADTMWGGDGVDVLTGDAGDDSLAAGWGDDFLRGGDGADTLNGGVGSDQMRGAAGNDVYYVDEIGDVVAENPDDGIDEIRSLLKSYSIASKFNMENLTYIGSADFAGTGNNLANVITGGAGNDTLTGGAGDTLVGGDGNNTYVLTSAGVTITSTTAGVDTVIEGLSSYTAAANVRAVVLQATPWNASVFANNLGNELTALGANANLVGGNGNDTMHGDAGGDALAGGLGNDVLYGASALAALGDKLRGGAGDDA